MSDLATPPVQCIYIGLKPRAYKDYVFGLERLTVCWDELTGLAAQEWVEVGDDARFGAFDPDLQTVQRHESQASIGAVTVRRRNGGELVGYFVGTVGVPLKTKGRRVFSEIGVYLSPDTRAGWLFKAFMGYVEDVARLFDCDALIVSHRPEHDRIGVLYRRFGYVPLACDYLRVLS